MPAQPVRSIENISAVNGENSTPIPIRNLAKKTVLVTGTIAGTYKIQVQAGASDWLDHPNGTFSAPGMLIMEGCFDQMRVVTVAHSGGDVVKVDVMGIDTEGAF